MRMLKSATKEENEGADQKEAEISGTGLGHGNPSHSRIYRPIGLLYFRWKRNKTVIKLMSHRLFDDSEYHLLEHSAGE